jgi:hypothetical protein
MNGKQKNGLFTGNRKGKEAAQEHNFSPKEAAVFEFKLEVRKINNAWASLETQDLSRHDMDTQRSKLTKDVQEALLSILTKMEEIPFLLTDQSFQRYLSNFIQIIRQMYRQGFLPVEIAAKALDGLRGFAKINQPILNEEMPFDNDGEALVSVVTPNQIEAADKLSRMLQLGLPTGAPKYGLGGFISRNAYIQELNLRRDLAGAVLSRNIPDALKIRSEWLVTIIGEVYDYSSGKAKENNITPLSKGELRGILETALAHRSELRERPYSKGYPDDETTLDLFLSDPVEQIQDGRIQKLLLKIAKKECDDYYARKVEEREEKQREAEKERLRVWTVKVDRYLGESPTLVREVARALRNLRVDINLGYTPDNTMLFHVIRDYLRLDFPKVKGTEEQETAALKPEAIAAAIKIAFQTKRLEGMSVRSMNNDIY